MIHWVALIGLEAGVMASEAAFDKLNKPKILAVGTADLGIKPLADAIRQKGFEPIFLCNKHDYRGDILQSLLAEHTLQIDDYAQITLLKVLRDNAVSNVQGVISTRDAGIEPAINLAKALNVPGMDAAIIDLNNKMHLKQLIPEFYPPTLLFNIADDNHDLVKFLEKHKAIILKPVRGTDSIGVFIMRTPDEIPSFRKEYAHVSNLWIAQAYLDGKGILLEGYVCNGEVRFIGFSSYYTYGKTDVAFAFPIDDRLAPSIRDKAFNAVKEMIARSGCKNSYFHVQFIVKDEIPYVIDPNFGRIGGSGFPVLLPKAYGISASAMYTHILNVSLGWQKNHDIDIFKRRPLKMLAINYGIKEQSTLLGIDLPRNITSLHALELNMHDKIPALGLGNHSWIGIIVNEHDKALQDVAAIKIKTADGVTGPYFDQRFYDAIGSQFVD